VTPWWFAFHQTPDIPEAGKGADVFIMFYHNLAYNPAAITQADINEFGSRR